MRFLVDECLAPALAAALQQAGHDAVNIVDLGQRGAPDTGVMQLAHLQERCAAGAIVVILDDRIRVRRLPIGADPEQP